MTIGQRIKNRRIELNMSQEDLARKMGYSTRNAIYQFEQKDNMKLSLVEKFARALDVSPAYLMGWEDMYGDESPYNKLVEAYIYRDRLDKYTPEQVMKALDFLDAFQTATPEARSAIEILLKSRRSDP